MEIQNPFIVNYGSAFDQKDFPEFILERIAKYGNRPALVT